MKADTILATIGETPHLRITRLFDPRVEVWVKLERANPGASIKDRIALKMIEEAEREGNIFGDPLETIWKNCIFNLCGVTNFHRRMFNVIVTSTEGMRKKWLDTVRKDIDIFFPGKNVDG